MATATLRDWLKSFAPVFQPMRGKPKTNRTLPVRAIFSRALSEILVVASNSDWFIAVFAHVVMGRSNFGIDFYFHFFFFLDSQNRSIMR